MITVFSIEQKQKKIITKAVIKNSHTMDVLKYPRKYNMHFACIICIKPAKIFLY